MPIPADRARNVGALLDLFFRFGRQPASQNDVAERDDSADDVHGVASAFVVVARMVGMLVGISALTTIGLRRYYSEQLEVPPVQEVCDGKSRCKEFSDLLRVAGIAQEHAVFWGAAGCAVVAAVLALVLFRDVRPTRLAARDVFQGAG